MSYVILTIVAIATSAGLWNLLIPALNLSDPNLWWMIIFSLAILSIAFFLAACIRGDTSIPVKISGSALGIIIVLFIICGIASSALFHTNAYRNVIAIDENSSFESKVPEVEVAGDIPVVDRATAQNLGDRTMGVMTQYISQYEVESEYNLIVYNGKYYRISPLAYGGFFKYTNCSDVGIPAYVLVDIYTSETKLVELNEKDRIFYAPSAYFGKDLYRHLRNTYPTTMFGAANFEIDDNGHPYYIVPVVKSTGFIFGAKKISAVCVVDATTGNSTIYDLDKVPKWVDNIYDVTYIMKGLEDHYALIHGVFNFSNKDVRRTSYHFDNNQFFEVPNNDDGVSIYTGITSAGSDESNIGFVMANVRTGKIAYIASPGAEESSAQTSAQNVVKQYGYIAGSVMLVNIDGKETYFMTLKGGNNLVQCYALVNKASYEKVAVEKTLEETVTAYRRLMASDEKLTASGIVKSVYTVIIDSNTHYLFTLAGDETLYISSIKNSYEQCEKLVPGAEIKFTFSEADDEHIVSTLTFTSYEANDEHIVPPSYYTIPR